MELGGFGRIRLGKTVAEVFYHASSALVVRQELQSIPAGKVLVLAMACSCHRIKVAVDGVIKIDELPTRYTFG
ncbi:MAG: hypothetical protein V3V08_19795 [Nannocystaceae bacterium]